MTEGPAGTCERCNEPFERTQPTKRFCSEKCRRATEVKRKQARKKAKARAGRTRPCIHCSAPFDHRGNLRRVACFTCLPDARVGSTGKRRMQAQLSVLVRATHKRIAKAAHNSPDNTLTALCSYCGTQYRYTAKRIKARKHRVCSSSCETSLRRGHRYFDRSETVTCGCGNTMPRWGGGAERKYCDECRSSGVIQRAWHSRNPEYRERRTQDRWLRNGATCRIPMSHPSRDSERKEKQRAYYYRDYHILGNKERYYRSAYKRRALLKANGSIDNIDRIAVFERDNYKCRVCGTKTGIEHDRMHPKRAILGHINALAAGGTHTWDNVCCLCYSCNVADGVNRIPIQTHIC